MTLILQGTDNSVSSPAVQGGTAGATTGIYYPASGQLAISTAGTLALIATGGTVGIGTTPYYGGTLCVAGVTITQGMYLNASVGGYQTTLSTDGGTTSTSASLKILNSGGSTLGTWQYGGNLAFGISNTGIIFNNSSATTNSTLNDYETGTWTPVFSGSVSGSGSPGGVTGSYVKIGKLVTVTVAMNNAVPFITFSGTLYCSLPFATGGPSGGDQFTGAPMYYYTGGAWNTGATTSGITPTTSTGQTFMNFVYMITNGDRQTAVGSSTCSLSSSNNIYARFSMTYMSTF